MSFDNIIGNEKIKQELQDTIKNNVISHSYLFVGTEGVGKKLFAKQFAKMILCLNEEIQCNKCDSCIKFMSENNPDFVVIEPDGNSIKIAQIREMQENVYKKPIVSKRKVFIINDCEKMTEEAQNSLLKTLEEPPEYIIIILIASNENKLLNTIKSRCLKISFSNINKDDLIKYVSNHQEINKPSDSLLEMCNGSIGKLIKINEDIEAYEEIEKSTKDLINWNIHNIIDLLNRFDILYKSKEIINNLLDYMIVIIYQFIRDNSIYKNKYLQLFTIIERTKAKLISNINYDMCIDELMLKIWECMY